MELFFRKYFWTLNLAFLALAALLVARGGNAVIAAFIAPAPDVDELAPRGEGKSATSVRAGTAHMAAEPTAKLFGIELPSLEPATAAPTAAVADDPNAEPVRSSLRASLIGTMVANRPEWSLATLRDDAEQAVGVYSPGDRFMTADVLAIERLRVILRNEGRREYIALKELAAAPTPAAAPVAVASKEDDGEGVSKIGEGVYEVTRAKIDEQLANLNGLSTQARIVPSFKDGVANGFKLFSIRPGSIYSQLGIQNGDVVKRINGYEINSPDKALEVYGKLKESAKIEIELERRGSPMKSTYNVK